MIYSGNNRLALSSTTHLSSTDIAHSSSDKDSTPDSHVCTLRQLHVQYRLATSTPLASPFRLAPTSPRSWHRTTPGASRVAPPTPHQTTTPTTATHRNSPQSRAQSWTQRYASAISFSHMLFRDAAGGWQWQWQRQGMGKEHHWGTWQRRACAQ
jgi:hypothetical protein